MYLVLKHKFWNVHLYIKLMFKIKNDQTIKSTSPELLDFHSRIRYVIHKWISLKQVVCFDP